MKTLTMLFVTIVVLLSCSKEELNKNENVISNESFYFEKVSGSFYKDKIVNWNKEHPGNFPFKNSNDELLSFDYNNLTLAYAANEVGNVIVANEVNYDEENDINYGIGYYEYNDQIIGSLLFELKKISEDQAEITYFSPEDGSFTSLQFNFADKSIKVFGNDSQLLKTTLMKDGWGKRTMDCVADAYSNHGAISVWAFVQTAFIPETAAAIAIACGIKNL